MNKKLLPFLLLAVLFTVTYFACKKADKKPVVDATNEYYPLQIGKYVIYNVDSTLWDDTLCVVQVRHHQMRYTVADTFTDAQGRLSYRVDIHMRHQTEDEWEPHSVFYVTGTSTTLETIHSGLHFINLQFPIANGTSWKGNAYVNTTDPDLTYFNNWDYTYSNVGGSFNNGLVVYNNTVTVNERDETIGDPENIPRQPATRNLSKEVYASGIGMIYRQYIHWTYDPGAIQNNDPNNPNRCRKGNGVVMTAVDHN